jgi:hypothetical protein
MMQSVKFNNRKDDYFYPVEQMVMSGGVSLLENMKPRKLACFIRGNVLRVRRACIKPQINLHIRAAASK